MHSPPRILIVDDNETNRDILIARLNVHGYELLQAADGEEALAAARQHRPDVILLDVMMPKLDGIEVTRRIKADPDMPFTPIILVTAKADSKDIVAGLEAGADEYAALTEREREVFHLMAEGLSNVEMADRLGISPRTAETHRAHVMRKLNLRRLADVVRLALQRGILPLDREDAPRAP